MFDHFRGFKSGKVLFLFSGWFFTFIRFWMDLLHLWLGCIGTGLLLRLIEQVHLLIAFRVFFAGRAKLLPLRKCQPIRKQCIHKLQFLRFFFQELDLCFLFFLMHLHGLYQCDDILFAHILQLFFRKKRFHDPALLSLVV